jgi:hypothetical protein
MKPLHDLWPLVRFEFRARLASAFMLIPLLCLVKMQLGNDVPLGLGFADSPLTMFFISFLLAAGIFAPGTLPGFQNKSVQNSHAEFLFSRALDRKNIFYAKTASILLIMLLPLLVLSPWVLRDPRLSIRLMSDRPAESRETAHRYQEVFPESELAFKKDGTTPDTILLPHGRLSLYGWEFAWSLFLALTAQGILLPLSRWKHCKKVFLTLYAAFFLSVFAPVFLVTFGRGATEFWLMRKGLTEPLILLFTQHSFLAGMGLLAYGALVITGTRNSFLQTEVP